MTESQDAAAPPDPATSGRNPLALLGWGVWLLWAGTLYVLSSAPAPAHPLQDFPFSDKIAHFGYFFIGGLALSAALHWQWRLSPRRIFRTVVAASLLVGALDEFHQSFVPNRFGNDMADLAADLAGGTAAAVVWILARRIINSHV